MPCDSKATADPKGRLYYFDNAKFILIFLVVLAHSTSSLKGSSWEDGSAFVSLLWAVINYFHMPAMIFISGFFAKSFISKSRAIKVQRVATYAILYLAAQVCYYMYQKFILGDIAAKTLMNPRPALWFLQCLVVWHLLLPVLDYFKPGYVMLACTLIGLFVGYENNAAGFLSISRVFVHLPFFMAGYYVKQERVDKLFSRKYYKWIGLAAFAAVTVICLIWPKTVLETLLTSSTPYARISALRHVPRLLQWTARLWFYGVASSLIIGFLALVPRGKTVFTALGRESLSVYILHIFLYLANRHFKWYEMFMSPSGIAFLIFIALAVTVVFSLKPFTIPFHWLQKIRVDKTLKAE